jgi:hypothetical protein
VGGVLTRFFYQNNPSKAYHRLTVRRIGIRSERVF